MARHPRAALKPRWPFMLAGGSNQADGLVGWWPGEPSRGLTLYDQSGRRNHGIINGATNPNGLWGNGKDGGQSALTLRSASHQYADCGAILSGTFTNLTMSCWCWKTAANVACPFGWQDTTSHALGVEWFTDGNIYWSADPAAVSYIVSAQNDAGPHLLTMVYNGNLSAANRVAAYVDGLPATITTTSGVLTASYTISGTFKIGKDTVNGVYTDGRHEDCRLYTRSLSPQEVWDLWDSSTRWQLRYQPSKTRYWQNPAGPGWDASQFPYTDSANATPYKEAVRMVPY